MAGKRPKKMPTLAEKPMPSAKDHHGSETGNPDSQCTSRPMPLPQMIPMTPPAEVRNGGFDQELPQDFAPPRAERFADADLARAFGDRDHHDGHDADAADHQRDRADDDEREEGGLAELVPHLERGVLGRELEVVLLLEPEVVPDAHDGFHFAQRLVAHALARDDGNHRGPERLGVIWPPV